MTRKRRVFIEPAAPTEGESLLRRVADALAAGRLPRAADRRAFVAAVEKLTPDSEPLKALGLLRDRKRPPLSKREKWARHEVPVGNVVAMMAVGVKKDDAIDLMAKHHGIKRSYLENLYKQHASAMRQRLTGTIVSSAGRDKK